MSHTPITVQVDINSSLQNVWEKWTNPNDIMQWNNASDDWHTPRAENNLHEDGTFSYTMAAKDGSFSFDFGGVYNKVIPFERLEYTIGDGRKVSVEFQSHNGVTTVTEVFEPEETNPIEMQQQGWQAILNNFKKHAER